MGKAAKEWSEYSSLSRGSFLSYLAGIYVGAHYLELSMRIPALEAIRFHFVFGLLLAVIALPKVLKSHVSDAASRSLVRSAYLLILILSIYTVFSIDQDTSTRLYIDRVLKFAMMALFIYGAVEKVDDLRIIMFITLLAWLKMGQEGFVGWLTGSLMWENQGIPRLHGSSPAFGHPNSYSGFAVGCLPFCLYLIPAIKIRFGKLLLLMMMVFALLIVVNTGSRTGYVAVLVGAAIFFYKIKVSLFKKVCMVLLAIVGTVTLLPEAYQERFDSIFTRKEKEGASAETRWEIITDAMEVFKANPLGVGVGAFPKARMNMFGRFQDTHNLYLELLTNVSVAGLIVFLVFVYRMMRLNLANARKSMAMAPADMEDAWKHRFLSGLAKAVMGFLLLRLVLGLFGMDTYEIYWWFALGLTLAINKLLLLEQRGTPISRSRRDLQTANVDRNMGKG